MGRWAQRQRGGGGPPLVLKQMTVATSAGLVHANVTYNQSVDATELAAADFDTEPSGQTPSAISQLGPTQIQLTFAEDVSTDETLTYTGSASGFLTPDQVHYS